MSGDIQRNWQQYTTEMVKTRENDYYTDRQNYSFMDCGLQCNQSEANEYETKFTYPIKYGIGALALLIT